MSIQDALVHLDDALEALTLKGWRSPTGQEGTFVPMAPIECTLAIDLERIDAALGPRGQSMFSPMAEAVKQAVIAIVAAQQSLGQEQPQ